MLLFSQAIWQVLASELAWECPWTPVILAKIELSTESSSSIEVELDKERTWEGGGMISERVKGCLSSLTNEVEDWLHGRPPNLNDLLSWPSDGRCDDGAGEASKLTTISFHRQHCQCHCSIRPILKMRTVQEYQQDLNQNWNKIEIGFLPWKCFVKHDGWLLDINLKKLRIKVQRSRVIFTHSSFIKLHRSNWNGWDIRM